MTKLFAYMILFCAFSLFAEGEKKVLVFGGEKGWVGRQIIQYLEAQGHLAVASKSRLENREEIIRELRQVQPDLIINCAGVTGIPNVDWCDDHKIETLRTNLIGTLNLIDIAYLHHLDVTNFSTGCIYEYDEDHPIHSGIGFTEDELPNFDGSFYSKTKGFFEQMVQHYPNVLNLRVRMPVTSVVHPKNFITKLTKYKKVINVPNSVTILEDLLPIAIDMAMKGRKGTYNFVNPGTISHNEILDLYKNYIDPDFQYFNFTVEEQDKILKSKRSNNELNVDKLMTEYPLIPHAKDSIHQVFQRMKNLSE